MSLISGLIGGGGGSSVGTGNPIFYAKRYGVTGINDGSRDDAPLIRTAYAEAVAAGASALVLPVGDVWMKTYDGTADSQTVYPYYTMLRIAASNFSIIVPEGCTVHIDETLSYAGGSSPTYSCFCIYNASTAKYSKITGGGHFKHEGNTTNRVMPAYITALTDDCEISNLSAENFYPQAVGVFDCSTSYQGRLLNLKVLGCFAGVLQSSGTSTTAVEIRNIWVKNYKKYGVGMAGANNTVSQIIADNSEYATAQGLVATNAGLYIQNRASGHRISDVTVTGSDITAGADARAVLIDGNVTGISDPITIRGLKASGVYHVFKSQGIAVPVEISDVQVSGCVNYADKVAKATKPNTGRVTHKNVVGAITGVGFQNTSAEGLDSLIDVNLTGASTLYHSSLNQRVLEFRGCTNPSTITRPITANGLAATDKGVQFYDNALASPRPIYYSGGTTVWYDGAGASV